MAKSRNVASTVCPTGIRRTWFSTENTSSSCARSRFTSPEGLHEFGKLVRAAAKKEEVGVTHQAASTT
jgi:hypothetical protein